MATILNLTVQLREVKTEAEKKELTHAIGRLLSENEKLLTRMFHAILSSKLPRKVGGEYALICKGDFFQKEVRLYKDSDGETKVAIGISYLQDFENSSDNMDYNVLNSLLEIIKDGNLELLVNDVAVNFIQSRNGNVIHID